jgi:hypothetical protein
MISTTLDSAPPTRRAAALRRVRIVHFCPWAGRLQGGAEFIRDLPAMDLGPRVSDPGDPALLVMARLDCDWHGENVRAFAAMRSEHLEFLPIEVVGVAGAADLLTAARRQDEETWFVIAGQHPKMLGGSAAALIAACARRGVRTLYYAFDEASHSMSCMPSIAPHLSVLIHDESPLAPSVRRALSPECAVIHRSWVANLVPFSAPFCAEPEEKIIFLGSKLGLTPHRRRQIDFLAGRFKDRFHSIVDHSLPVPERLGLSRYKVSFCPEGRMFSSDAMSQTHTDRPFWSGCLGMAPVSENSRRGGRLEELHREGLIRRYTHGDLKALAEACEGALAATESERRRIYEHFNRHETVGAVVAAAIESVGVSA